MFTGSAEPELTLAEVPDGMVAVAVPTGSGSPAAWRSEYRRVAITYPLRRLRIQLEWARSASQHLCNAQNNEVCPEDATGVLSALLQNLTQPDIMCAHGVADLTATMPEILPFNFEPLLDFARMIFELPASAMRGVYIARAWQWYGALLECAEQYAAEIYGASIDWATLHTAPSLGVLSCKAMASVIRDAQTNKTRYDVLDCANVTASCIQPHLDSVIFNFKIASKPVFFQYNITNFPLNVSSAGVWLLDMPTPTVQLYVKQDEFYMGTAHGVDNSSALALCILNLFEKKYDTAAAYCVYKFDPKVKQSSMIAVGNGSFYYASKSTVGVALKCGDQTYFVKLAAGRMIVSPPPHCIVLLGKRLSSHAGAGSIALVLLRNSAVHAVCRGVALLVVCAFLVFLK